MSLFLVAGKSGTKKTDRTEKQSSPSFPTRTNMATNTLTPTFTPTVAPTSTLPPFSHADFTYDGDGKQVKAVVGSVTTYYVGAHYQVDNGVVTKYYFAGATRVAMRKNGTLSYLLGDHLGSTSITANSSGALVSELRYKPWGETRYTSGTTPTTYQFTGQRNEASFGLYFYGARWYDSALGRFAQADTVVPDGVQGYDRYAYGNNDPVKYIDPSGHTPCHDDNWEDGPKCVTDPASSWHYPDQPAKTITVIEDTLDSVNAELLKMITERENKFPRVFIDSVPPEIAGGVVGSIVGWRACGWKCSIVGFIGGLSTEILVDKNTVTDTEAYRSVSDAITVAQGQNDEEYNVTLDQGKNNLLNNLSPYQYTLTIGEADPIVLTTNQAWYLNTLFGGGLIP